MDSIQNLKRILNMYICHNETVSSLLCLIKAKKVKTSMFILGTELQTVSSQMNFQKHVSDNHPQSWVTYLTQKLFLLQMISQIICQIFFNKHKTGSYSKQVTLWIFIKQLQSENINVHDLDVLIEIFDIWSWVTNRTQKLFLPKMNF